MYFMHMYILHQYCMYFSCQDKNFVFLILILFDVSAVEHYFLDWIEILGAEFSESKAGMLFVWETASTCKIK